MLLFAPFAAPMEDEELDESRSLVRIVHFDLASIVPHRVDLLDADDAGNNAAMEDVLPADHVPSPVPGSLHAVSASLTTALSASIPAASTLCAAIRRAAEAAEADQAGHRRHMHTELQAAVVAAAQANKALELAVSVAASFQIREAEAPSTSPNGAGCALPAAGSDGGLRVHPSTGSVDAERAHTTTRSDGAGCASSAAGVEGAGRAHPETGAGGAGRADSAPGSDGGATPLELPPPSVLFDMRALVTFFLDLVDVCPIPRSIIAGHVGYLCKRMGYACFTRRGLCRFAVRAFRAYEGDPESTPSLIAFRKMIPHAAGVYWDERFRLNALELYNVCGEHCDDVAKRNGSSHALVD